MLVLQSNYVCMSYRFWDILRQIMVIHYVVIWQLYTTSYWSTTVSAGTGTALSWTVVTLFDAERYHDTEIWVTGHSTLLKTVPHHSKANDIMTLKSGLQVTQHYWKQYRTTPKLTISWHWNLGYRSLNIIENSTAPLRSFGIIS